MSVERRTQTAILAELVDLAEMLVKAPHRAIGRDREIRDLMQAVNAELQRPEPDERFIDEYAGMLAGALALISLGLQNDRDRMNATIVAGVLLQIVRAALTRAHAATLRGRSNGQ